MHILYIHQYFSTPNGKTGTRSYEFARRWVSAGHRVTMLTTVANMTKNDLVNAQGRFVKRFTTAGIDILVMPVPYRQQMRMFVRCFSFLGFVLTACIATLSIKEIDIIFATSTPLTVGIPALIGKKLRQIPFVFEIRDQWPEVPIQLGVIKNKTVIKFLLWLEKTIYHHSSALVAASPGQAEGIKAVYPHYKIIHVVPNCCDVDVIRPDIDGNMIRKKHHWNNQFVFLHAGAMGQANNLDFVIDVAEQVKDKEDILFVLLGQGSQKPMLRKRMEKLNLKNVEILPPVAKNTIPQYFAAADVALVIFGDYPILQHNSANKFFDALSAGKPVLLNYGGWQRELLEDNNAGAGCSLCHLEEFKEKVLNFYSHREKLTKMGRHARQLAENMFNRKVLAHKTLDILQKVQSQSTPISKNEP